MLIKAAHLPAILLSLFACGAYAESIAVIVNKGNPEESLSRQHISNIFLGRINRFPGGGEADPIDLAATSELHEEFYKKVVKKSPAQLRAYWSRLVFTGKGTPPRQVDNSEGARSIVANESSTIGYIDVDAVDPSVRVMLLAQ